MKLKEINPTLLTQSVDIIHIIITRPVSVNIDNSGRYRFRYCERLH